MFESYVEAAEEHEDTGAGTGATVPVETAPRTSLDRYDGLSLPDDVQEGLREEVEAAYADGCERSGLLRYEDGEVTGMVDHDWLADRGLMGDRSEASVEWEDALYEAVAELNDGETQVLGYHTHPRDRPESDFRDRREIDRQEAPEVVVLEDGGEYRARLVGIADDDDRGPTIAEMDATDVEGHCQGLEYRELEI